MFKRIIAMNLKDRITTNIFVQIDDFCKGFDAQIKKSTLKHWAIAGKEETEDIL